MMEHDHRRAEQADQPGRTSRQNPSAMALRAATDGRTDVLDAAGVLDLQRTAGNAATAELVARSPVLDVVGSGGGTPLDTDTRAEMEARLGHDFGDVRVHTDARAHDSAAAVNAHAYTVGTDIVFQRSAYDPTSTAGKRTLAHELTHVVQQRSGPVEGTPTGDGVAVSDPSDRFEREAEATAEAALSTPAAPVTALPAAAAAPQPTRSVQRDGPVGSVLSSPASHAPVATRPAAPLGAESVYIDATQRYVSAYRTAALQGVTAFQNAVATAPDFDWLLFGGQVAGNIIWAAACFVPGGAVFPVSMAGIALTTASAAAAVTDAPTYSVKASAVITDIWNYLNDRTGSLVSDTYAQAQKQGWSDSGMRDELLHKMLAPNYIVTRGGLPNVDEPAVTASVLQQVLIDANATQPRSGSAGRQALNHLVPTLVRDLYTGYVLYSYKVGNLEHDEGLFYRDTMNDVGRWSVGAPSTALVTAANVGDVNATMNAAQRDLRGAPMHPAAWPCRKAINLYADHAEDPTLVVTFAADNILADVRGWGSAVNDYLDDHDRLALGRQVALRVWGRLTPPDVARLDASPELFKFNNTIQVMP